MVTKYEQKKNFVSKEIKSWRSQFLRQKKNTTLLLQFKLFLFHLFSKEIFVDFALIIKNWKGCCVESLIKSENNFYFLLKTCIDAISILINILYKKFAVLPKHYPGILKLNAANSNKLRSRTPFARIHFFPFVCFKAPQNFKTFEKSKKAKTPLFTRPSSFLRQINTSSRDEDKRC